MKFIHSADLHLGTSFETSSLPKSFSRFRREDIWSCLEDMVSYSRDKTIDFIFLSGDLYNRENFNSLDMNRLVNLFRKTNSQICIIAGNHDYISTDSLWDEINLPDNVYVFKNDYLEKIEYDEVDVYGVSYNKRNYPFFDGFDGLKLDKFKHNVLLIHSDILTKDDSYMPFDINVVRNLGFDYVALGHIHKPTIINDIFVYPGSIEPLNFKYNSINGFISGNLDNRSLDLDFIDCSRSKFTNIEFDLSGSFNYYDLVEKLKDSIVEGKKNYVSLTLKGLLEDKYDLDFKALEVELSKYCDYIEIIDETEDNIDLESLYKLNKTNIVGYFLEEINKNEADKKILNRAKELGLKALLENN
ncbi:MAG: metallophosphoesterase family protein [Finegoldia sp.]|nr:metallophosphoesterase family protein [Finegoldia sp.]